MAAIFLTLLAASVFTKSTDFSFPSSAVNIRATTLWRVERRDRSQVVPDPSGSQEIEISGKMKVRDKLIDVLNGKLDKVVIKKMLPKVVEISNEGDALAVSGFFGINNSGIHTYH